MKDLKMTNEAINTAIKLYSTTLSINQLAQFTWQINKNNGWNVVTPEDWNDEFKIPAKLCLTHSELSEGLEGFRANDRVNFGEELADTVIRIFDIAAGLEIDLQKEITDKLLKNTKRGHRHGNQKV